MLPKLQGSVLPFIGRAILLMMLVAGCSGDDPSRPGSGSVPTFENIWPVGVGRYWTYDLTEEGYEEETTLYDRVEDVPALPDMEELYADLHSDPPGAELESSSASIHYSVSADLTTDPDTAVMAFDYSVVNEWRRSSDRIATYGGGYLQWVHLDGGLTPGHEFSVQLAAGLADDIFLHNRVWRSRSFEVMDTTYTGCVECFYIIDMGISQVTGEDGSIRGYLRDYRYGMVIYAPVVGPVYCKEMRPLGPSFIQDDFVALEVREAVLREFGMSE
jgi:hypothetical protein